MKPTNVYLKNILELSVSADCDLNKFYVCFPHIDDILLKCGFSKKFVEHNRKRFENKVIRNKTTLVFDTPLIKERADIQHLILKFIELFNYPKYIEAGFVEHENELIMLSLLLHNYYWLDDYGIPKDNYKTDKLAKDVNYNELSLESKNLVELQEITAVIKLLIAYNVRLKKEDRMDSTLQMNLSFYDTHAEITSDVSLAIIINSIELGLSKAEVGQIGDGVGIINEYFDAKDVSDYSNLNKLISNIEKHEPYKSQNPPIKRAFAAISFHIQAYLIEHQLIKPKARPALLLSFLEDIFEILKIEFTDKQTKTAESKKELSVILKDQRESMRFKKGEKS